MTLSANWRHSIHARHRLTQKGGVQSLSNEGRRLSPYSHRFMEQSAGERIFVERGFNSGSNSKFPLESGKAVFVIIIVEQVFHDESVPGTKYGVFFLKLVSMGYDL